jgi:glyoxylase-like metal-dependent hydrolase (beta-lactamase superfamily II)
MTICEPLADRATFIKPGDEVVSGIRSVDAAGHSPGLMAFHIESNGKRFMVTADTFTHYVMGVQRPDWHFDMDDDKDKAVATRKRMLDMLATERLIVASFHMPFPGLGWIEKTATGHRWVPHSYQMNV